MNDHHQDPDSRARERFVDAFLSQRFDDPAIEGRDGSAFLASLALRLDVPLPAGLFLRLGGGPAVYVLETQSTAGATVSAPVTWRAEAGLGATF